MASRRDSTPDGMGPDGTGTAGMRLDKWLWYARLSPSRSAAQKLCATRHCRLDGRVVQRGCTMVRPGAVLSFPKGRHVFAVRVEALGERRGPAAEARQLYTPLLGPLPGLLPGAPACAPCDATGH